jgi:hypothetical protein
VQVIRASTTLITQRMKAMTTRGAHSFVKAVVPALPVPSAVPVRPPTPSFSRIASLGHGVNCCIHLQMWPEVHLVVTSVRVNVTCVKVSSLMMHGQMRMQRRVDLRQHPLVIQEYGASS